MAPVEPGLWETTGTSASRGSSPMAGIGILTALPRGRFLLGVNLRDFRSRFFSVKDGSVFSKLGGEHPAIDSR